MFRTASFILVSAGLHTVLCFSFGGALTPRVNVQKSESALEISMVSVSSEENRLKQMEEKLSHELKKSPDNPVAEKISRQNKENSKKSVNSASNSTVGANLETPAEAAQNPSPIYPLKARRLGHEGLVVLKVRVLEAGVPGEIRTLKSSGYGTLDSSARKAVKNWKFVPARKGKNPIDSWLVIPVQFKLE